MAQGGYTSPQKRVPQLVEQQAALRPNAIAVTAGPRRLTYRELNERADGLASQFRAFGVCPDVPAALCVKSSLAMIVGALGIMKAGGAYLPLDPDYPAERLSFILKDASVPVLVGAKCASAAIPSGPWRTVGLDADGRLGEAPAPSAPPAEAHPDHLAYVIYTSGSTGQPKGVEIEHKSLVNLVEWHQCAFAVTPEDRASQVAGVGFDAAVWEIWPYLTAGASVHIAPDEARTDPEKLRDWLLSERITISFVPTIMAERLMALEWPEPCALRTLLTGADTLHHYPSARLPFTLVNNYGPTECTVVATSAIVPPKESANDRPPIGRPIANVKVYILDERLKPVPVGTPGELHVGGTALARGYRKRPDLTSEKFIPSPFEASGARLYKTGDLARELPDGQIQFLGRVDDQVKIRGYRIEPNEIVCALNQHPEVKESAVIARELAPGDRRLVAYFVPSVTPPPARAALRDFLGARLPDYMVPGAFVRLDRLPLNAHGKLDRAALPEPSAENTLQDESFEGPSSPVEERLAALLAELLGGQRVGVTDNFFNLGGHSLLGAQLVARVRDNFGVELSLRALFDHPTVRGMSAEIEALIIEKLDSMSEEEAQRMLASSGTASSSASPAEV